MSALLVSSIRVTMTVGAAVLVLAAGCSQAESADRRADVGASTTGAASTGPGSKAAVGERLAGRYAHYDVVAYESADMKTLIISYGFTDLSMKDGELMAKESFCHAEHRSDQPIETTMSDAATSAIKPVATPVELTTNDGKIRFHRPETPTGVGIHLENPATDVLPTDPADPRIADDDGDGKPGITVHIKVTDELQGDLYIARRERFAYDVAEDGEDGDRLVGTVTDKSEQLIVGATNPIFITKAEWVQVADRSKSPIILIKVDPKRDCAWLNSQRDDLFPAPPVVDW